MRAPAIFVIEDDDCIRADLTEILTSEGYEVTAFANGKEGLDALTDATAAPQLVILDLMMPVMSGYELLDERAKSERLSAIPVLVVSADGQAKARLPADRVRRFMSKPVDLDELLDAVKEIAG